MVTPVLLRIGEETSSKEQLESNPSYSALLRTASATCPQTAVSAAGYAFWYLLIVSLKKITNPLCKNFRVKSSNRISIENLPNESDLCRRLYPVTVLIQGACFLCGYSTTVWLQFFPIQPLYDISLGMKSKLCHFRVWFLLHTCMTDLATITAAVYNFTTKPFFFDKWHNFLILYGTLFF